MSNESVSRKKNYGLNIGTSSVLIIIVILIGYENFISRLDCVPGERQITWLGTFHEGSRIRDVDMAAETVEMTKDQILTQAGTAMLAQANQLPQNVLSLLRG